MSAAPLRVLTLSLALTVATWPSDSTAGFIPGATTPITVETGKPVPAGRVYQAGRTSPSSGHTAKVTFLRDKGMVAVLATYKISVDGKPGFDMHAGEFQTLYMAPGAHMFTLEMNDSQIFTESATTAELQNGVAISHSYSVGHGVVLRDGETETYRISTNVNDLGPRVETVEATNGAPIGPWTGLHGRIETGRYFPPGEKVTFRAPAAGVLPEVEGYSVNFLRDRLNMEFDRGYVVHSSLLGIEAVHYAKLAGMGIESPSDTIAYRAALDKAWVIFMRNVFTAATPRAEVVYQEHVSDQGKEMLFSIVRLPGVSLDLQVKDGYPATLMLIDGDYAVLLRSWKDNVVDAKRSPKDRAAAALPGLLARRSELDFRQTASAAAGQ